MPTPNGGEIITQIARNYAKKQVSIDFFIFSDGRRNICQTKYTFYDSFDKVNNFALPISFLDNRILIRHNKNSRKHSRQLNTSGNNAVNLGSYELRISGIFKCMHQNMRREYIILDPRNYLT